MTWSFTKKLKQKVGVPVLQGYGMTEVPMISMSRDSTDEQRSTTAGFPLRVRLCHQDSRRSAQAAPEQSEGEICVQGPMVFARYGDDELTEMAFDDEGYFPEPAISAT